MINTYKEAEDPLWTHFQDEDSPWQGSDFHTDSKLSKLDGSSDAPSWTCNDCGSSGDPIKEEDRVVCYKCGTLIEYLIDSSAEWRWFGSDDRNPDPCRVGSTFNPLLPQSSLGTMIQYKPETIQTCVVFSSITSGI